MRKQTLFLFLVLSVSAVMLAMPASAAEVTITFDDHSPNLQVNTPLTTQYRDQGVTFSGATVVDTNPYTAVDLGFTPSSTSGGVCTLTFNPYVRSVKLDFEDAAIGVMDAITVNGQSLSNYDTILNGGHLEVYIRDNTNPITSVEVHSAFHLKTIQFDNLSYDQIPEFPTVVLPVAAVLGILFIFQRRKN